MIIDKLKIVCYNRQKRERKGAAEMQTRWCELCGSCEVVQREGMYVCLFCGMEYTPKEAERLAGHAGHALRAAAVRGIPGACGRTPSRRASPESAADSRRPRSRRPLCGAFFIDFIDANRLITSCKRL